VNGPFALGVAPIGARKTRADHPALPLHPREIAETAARCREAGAARLHWHVRRPDGSHSLARDDYRPAIEAVRRAVGDRMVLQLTTEAVDRYTPAQRVAARKALRLQAVSVALREITPADVARVRRAWRWRRTFLNGCTRSRLSPR
jgi:3-keto-5-aminohexanoate cleavage enzyme